MSRCLDAPRILFVVFAASCGADGRLDEPPDPLGGCALDADCPTGLLCRDAACVSSEDQRPPELETEARLLQPIATDRYLFAPSIDTNSVLLVDPASLDITAVPVPVSYTHLRAHETGAYLVCRLLLEKKKTKIRLWR